MHSKAFWVLVPVAAGVGLEFLAGVAAMVALVVVLRREVA
jgi:hypothetical protein